MLGEDKYGSGSGTQWSKGGARYPALYRSLLYIKTILGLMITFYELKSSKTIGGLVCGLWTVVLLVCSHSHGLLFSVLSFVVVFVSSSGVSFISP